MRKSLNPVYQTIEKQTTEALTSQGRTVHHSVKCHPHIKLGNEFISIMFDKHPSKHSLNIVYLNRRTEQASLPMTIQKKWDAYRQHLAPELKLVIADNEIHLLPDVIHQVINIMERQQPYAAIQDLLPFSSEMSKDSSLIISDYAAEFYPS